MITYGVPIVYFVVALLCVYPARQYLFELCVVGEPDSMDHIFGAILGVLIAILWPVFVGFAICYKTSRFIWEKFLDDKENDNERVR